MVYIFNNKIDRMNIIRVDKVVSYYIINTIQYKGALEIKDSYQETKNFFKKNQIIIDNFLN